VGIGWPLSVEPCAGKAWQLAAGSVSIDPRDARIFVHKQRLPVSGQNLCHVHCAAHRLDKCQRPTFTLGSSRVPAAANGRTDSSHSSLGAVSGLHPQPCAPSMSYNTMYIVHPLFTSPHRCYACVKHQTRAPSIEPAKVLPCLLLAACSRRLPWPAPQTRNASTTLDNGADRASSSRFSSALT
jgi:hypothetical protein